MEREKTTFLKINNRWHSFKMFCIKRAQFISLNYWKNCNTYFVFKIKETSTKIFSPYQLRNFLSKEQDYHDTFFREKEPQQIIIFLNKYFPGIIFHYNLKASSHFCTCCTHVKMYKKAENIILSSVLIRLS